jgi:hypothetical protein
MLHPLVLAALALAAPGQDTAEPQQSAPARTDVTIHFASKEQRKPLPYETVGGLIIFKARVAGREVLMLLDNRAERSTIDLALARDAGLTLVPGGTARTPTGEIPFLRALDVPLVLPGQFETRTRLAAMDLSAISKAMGRKIEAILGGDFLGALTISANSGKSQLSFVPSGVAKVPPTIPPIALIGARPQLEVTIGGKPLVVTLDLGSNQALSLTPEAWARVGAKDAVFTSRPVFHADGQPHMVDFTRVPEMKLGALKRRDVEVSVRPWQAANGDGIMGIGMLKESDFLLDIKLGKLWVIPRLPSKPAR